MSAPDPGSRKPAFSRRWVAAVPALAFAALAGLFLLRLGAGDASRIPSVLIGKVAPTFSLPPLPGLANIPGLTDADLRVGRVTVVNVFASWCVPCREEHPVLMELARSGVDVVGISYKDEPENTRRFIGQGGNPFTRIGVDRSGRTGIDWGVTGVPESFVVRGDGTVAYRHWGPITPQALRDEVLPAIRKAGTGGA